MNGNVVPEDEWEGLRGRDSWGNPVSITAAWVVAIAWDQRLKETLVELLDGRLLAIPKPYDNVLQALSTEHVTVH